jgi:pimeloyl-ACP methyl ester carboxylesterase
MSDGPLVYRYADGEFMLAYGPKIGPQLIILQPFFEEMNRCRALVSGLCRALAAKGFGCWLPDLPGTGESLRALETVTWAQWIEAVEAATTLIAAETGEAPSSLALRGGALVEAGTLTQRWRLSPTTGRSLLSDLRRSALASGSDPATPAGYRLSDDLGTKLATAGPITGIDIRTVRLLSDDREADHHIPGAPIWRRPEPDSDPVLLDAIVDDITGWAIS